MGIIAVVAVVPHDEEAMVWDGAIAQFVVGRRGGIGFGEGFIVAVHLVIVNADVMAARGHDALDEGLFGEIAVFLQQTGGIEHNHIAHGGGMEMIGHLFDNDAIARFQGRQH